MPRGLPATILRPRPAAGEGGSPPRGPRPPPRSALVGKEELRLRMGISLRKLESVASAGRLPRPVNLHGRLVKWREAEIEGWMRASCPDAKTWEMINPTTGGDAQRAARRRWPLTAGPNEPQLALDRPPPRDRSYPCPCRCPCPRRRMLADRRVIPRSPAQPRWPRGTAGEAWSGLSRLDAGRCGSRKMQHHRFRS